MRRQPPAVLRTPALAGWLFADLFLVLFIIGIASLPPALHKPAHHHQSHRSIHHQRAPVHRQQVMDPKPVTFVIHIPPANIADPATRSQAISTLIHVLDRRLVAHGLQGRRAGFVLVFASGPTSAIGEAVSTANSVARALRKHDPTFAGAGTAGYWGGAGDVVDLKVFFFAQ